MRLVPEELLREHLGEPGLAGTRRSREAEYRNRLIGPSSCKSAPKLQGDAFDGAVLSNDTSFDASCEIIGINDNRLMSPRLHGVLEGILVC
jgi:hypothetical protein